MSNFLNPSQLLNQILSLQRDAYAKEYGKKVIVKENYLNEFSMSENSLRIIFDHINFKILHISDNVETLGGYKTKDFYDYNMIFVFKLFFTAHFNFMYIWLKWSFQIHSKLGAEFNSRQSMCGIKVKHKDGHIMRLLFRHYTLEENEEGIITLAAITLDDITHLMKADFYWGRIECGVGERQIHHLTSNEKESKPGDILSDREKETLRLLAQGKESKEIASLLYISSHTVDNHRRNMIAKTGVRDTTGLIQICKMVGII
jgi:DNA-binding CsgD family transcriptional regulator